jgi:hypothetical protein
MEVAGFARRARALPLFAASPRLTQKQNAPDALAERGGVEFQFAVETRHVAHLRNLFNVSAVVSTETLRDDDEHLKPAR